MNTFWIHLMTGENKLIRMESLQESLVKLQICSRKRPTRFNPFKLKEDANFINKLLISVIPY